MMTRKDRIESAVDSMRKLNNHDALMAFRFLQGWMTGMCNPEAGNPKFDNLLQGIENAVGNISQPEDVKV